MVTVKEKRKEKTKKKKNRKGKRTKKTEIKKNGRKRKKGQRKKNSEYSKKKKAKPIFVPLERIRTESGTFLAESKSEKNIYFRSAFVLWHYACFFLFDLKLSHNRHITLTCDVPYVTVYVTGKRSKSNKRSFKSAPLLIFFFFCRRV